MRALLARLEVRHNDRGRPRRAFGKDNQNRPHGYFGDNSGCLHDHNGDGVGSERYPKGVAQKPHQSLQLAALTFFASEAARPIKKENTSLQFGSSDIQIESNSAF